MRQADHQKEDHENAEHLADHKQLSVAAPLGIPHPLAQSDELFREGHSRRTLFEFDRFHNTLLLLEIGFSLRTTHSEGASGCGLEPFHRRVEAMLNQSAKESEAGSIFATPC